MRQPTLESNRLLLRPFSPDDAKVVQLLAGAYEIADTTLNVPHPYEDGMAEQWISGHQESLQAETNVVFAIVKKEESQLTGAIGLTINKNFYNAELGYWIGKPFWNQGFATEAARLIIDFGFSKLGLNRISAQHFVRNPASGKVMLKLGMVHEGTLRQAVIKWGEYEDLHLYGLLRNDWESGKD